MEDFEIRLSDSIGKPLAKARVKNSQRSKIIIIIIIIDRLYVSRKEGGRGLSSIEDSVEVSIQRLEDYIQKHDEGLITAIRNDNDYRMDHRMTITRKQKWEGKQIYGRFKRLRNNISHDKTWAWLTKGNLKRETESLLIAAKKQRH